MGLVRNWKENRLLWVVAGQSGMGGSSEERLGRRCWGREYGARFVFLCKGLYIIYLGWKMCQALQSLRVHPESLLSRFAFM